MRSFDMIVIGAGISGLGMAHYARQAGMRVCVLEASSRVGGCLHTAVGDDGFWLELGAHTCFNSYGRLLQIMRELGLIDRLVLRERLPYRLWQDGRSYAVAARLNWLELMLHAWQLPWLSKRGRTVAGYYRRLLGRGNYERVLRHAFAAVICQPADNVPADLLFRRRARDKRVPRSFTLPGGLMQIATTLAAQCDCRLNHPVRALRRVAGGFEVVTDGGVLHGARVVCATPAPVAAQLLAEVSPQIAGMLSGIAEASVESVAVAVPRAQVGLPPLAGLIAVDDAFYSMVSRDVVPHPQWRGFTFHFRPGRLDAEGQLAHIGAVLGVEQSVVRRLAGKRNRLPSPDATHHARIAALNAALEGQPLGLVGNYFQGVAIEDCLARVAREFKRLSVRSAGLPAGPAHR